MEVGEEIRSFKVRAGRLGPASRDAMVRLWPVHGVTPPYDALVRDRPLVLEIGSGMGEATAAMAVTDPGSDVLAVEVHPAGVAALLRRIEEHGLTNVRVVQDDAVAVLGALPERSLAEARLFFPDPWPKSRHAKRRLLRPSFAALLATRLADGGRLHLATDWPGYVEHALEVLADDWDTRVVDRPAHRPVTRFERQGLDAGRPSTDVYASPRRLADWST
ncbi:MAG: tRNA ((7)-)-methyltransferase [Frankiales bacterium]|nr:tRNA ((7)-)-methyltransferase [Frankiales bacterium]